MRLFVFFVLGIFLSTAAVVSADGTNPTVGRIQRTMKEMADSTAERPATVRILFYGQSIVAQSWTEQVQEYLKAAYPTVRFEFANRAIGGYTSPALIRTAESDLYPWYPDLLFFHVYGPTDKYEEIIRRTRERTTAEIVLWTSHLSQGQDPKGMMEARDDRSREILAIAERRNCMAIDLNQKWCRFLLDHNRNAADLLSDNIHLNLEGCRLYAGFITEELIRIPDAVGEPEGSGTIREASLDDPSVTKNGDGSITLSFDGNRVVAVSDGTGQEGAEASLLLDGERMNADPALWATTRPSNGPIWMPAINLIGHRTTPVEEEWTLTALDGSAEDGSVIKYKVEGSVTGPDGEGVNTERFVSNSGRVVIEPSDFNAPWQFQYSKKSLPPGFCVTWKNLPLFADPYRPTPAETRTTLVQNCVNGPHRLTIQPKNGGVGIGKFLIYSPAKQENVIMTGPQKSDR